MKREHQLRLTWDEALCRPYDSAWSTFVRVCTLNAMAPNELVRLIACNGRRQVAPGRSWKSEWFDFGRYGALLGVSPAMLRDGFLDRLGFPQPDRQDYAVRHCRKCWLDGYHCSLFDLSIVAACPWHGVALSAPCVSCASITPRHIKDMYEIKSLVCRDCGLRYPSAREILSKKMPKERADEIRRHCDSLVAWKQRCDKRLPSGLHLLGSVGALDSGDRADTTAWQLGLAKAVASGQTPWTFAVRPASVHVTEITSSHCYGADFPLTDNAQHDLLCKTLRRNLYKRHVRPHRGCLHQLTQLAHQGLSAHKGNVCTTALAYLIWHMRMKQTCNSGGLRISKKNRMPNRSEPPMRDMFGLAGELMLVYGEFFGLWLELENRCGRENFDINLVGDVRYRYTQFFALEGSDTEPPHAAPKDRLLIFYPSPQALSVSAAERCQTRRALSESMTISSYTEWIGRWCWSSKTGQQQRTMFQIRDEHLLSKGVAAPTLV
jgi:hypothetical protein